jgi:hypothetical protein
MNLSPSDREALATTPAGQLLLVQVTALEAEEAEPSPLQGRRVFLRALSGQVERAARVELEAIAASVAQADPG